MYQEKLSIIIPTKNRQIYACKCVETLLKKLPDGYEIIVQDNSDDDSLQGMLGALVDGVKLKYAYESKCLSFCDNFERGLLMSTGDYATMIGDDDCVLPEIIELTDKIRKKGVESVIFPTCHSYYWPNALQNGEGKLVIRDQNPYVKTLYTKDAIDKMVSSGDYDYQKYNFPKIYHGIVKRECLDKIKEKTGHFFGGLTPDIYSAVALSFYIDKILYVNTPFTLPGVCAKSGSADSLTGRHTGELKDAPHFRGHVDYKWEESIPYVYSVNTIWAETAFKAIKENGGSIKLGLDDYFNFLSCILTVCPDFEERLVAFYVDMTKEDSEKVAKRMRSAAQKRRNYYKRNKYINFGLQLLRGRHTYLGVNDIEAAIELILGGKNTLKKTFKLIDGLDW